MMWLECEMLPLRLMCLKTWSPNGGMVCEVCRLFKGRTLLEEGNHYGWVLRSCSTEIVPFMLCFLDSDTMLLSRFPFLPSCLPAYCHVFPTMDFSLQEL